MFQRRRRVRPVTVDPHAEPLVSAWPFFGLVLLAAAFFLYVASGLLVPWWAWLVLMLVWLVLLPPALREWGSAPMRPVLLGLAAFVIWALVVIGGGVAFGWDPWWPALTQASSSEVDPTGSVSPTPSEEPSGILGTWRSTSPATPTPTSCSPTTPSHCSQG